MAARRVAIDGRQVAWCLGLLATLALGCTRGPLPARKVVLLGIDGMDLRLLDRMVAAKQMPNFARLYREGAVGPISTFEAGFSPLSPRIWTSFATGKLPAEHGITAFVYTNDAGTRLLFSSRQRKAAAVWEIASAAGKRVGVVNWWVSYPAEAVNGFVVSDRYHENWARRSASFYKSELKREDEQLVYPPALAAKLDAAVVEARQDAESPDAAEKIDRSILELAYTATAAYPVDLLLVYTRALDELSHLRWHTHEPRTGEPPPKQDEITEYMRRLDAMLGEFTARLVGPHDHLVILSDHGFERDADPKGLTTGTHTSKDTAYGTFILWGPRVRVGQRIEGAGLLDALPTILELAEISPSWTMEGTVIKEALADGIPPRPRVGPYLRAALPVEQAADPTAADDSSIERLKALGYIQ
jgi:predicted AlkP superfamily phosphohydrolase/phosphomutase